MKFLIIYNDYQTDIEDNFDNNNLLIIEKKNNNENDNNIGMIITIIKINARILTFSIFSLKYELCKNLLVWFETGFSEECH